MPELTDPLQVVAGASHSCALDAGGLVCWGRNDLGQTDPPVSLVFGPGVRIKAVGEPVTSEGEVDGTTLIFHLDDWNQPQSVGVHCVDDAVYDGDLRYTVGPVPIPLTMAPASSPSH